MASRPAQAGDVSVVGDGPAVAAHPACQPNISARGRRRRRRFGFMMSGVVALTLAVLIAAGAAWYWAALVFLPAVLAAFSFLEARRNTCVLRAAEGTFEHEDLSRTWAAADEVAVSRRVAAGINRDAVLLGLASAVACMAILMAAANVR